MMLAALAGCVIAPVFEVGPTRGKRIVLIAGDEEYRSEEMLPQLAKILAKHHGFRCTVVFSQNDRGEIDPEAQSCAPGIEALDRADGLFLMTRFRNWNDADMAHFVRYFQSGKPIVAIRTTTHAFQFAPDSTSPFRLFSWNSKLWPGGFGKQVLGETWVSHWGNHGTQATKGHVVAKSDLLNGVDGLFGTTDVYEANPPADATVLINGEVLDGLEENSPSATGEKKTASGTLRLLNQPMMPIVWTRNYKDASGKTNKILTSTFGCATDFMDARFRRLLVNAAYWSVGKRIPKSAKVDLVGEYRPSPFGFGKFRRGVKPSDY